VDVVIRSPGFAPAHVTRQAVDGAGLLQTTATNVFIAEVRHAALPLVGVTGSKGKSTTSTLAHRLLQQAGVPTVLVGNIGRAALDALPDILARRLTPVMELSSYQCDGLDVEGPSVAGLLDLFPEHLNYHGDVGAYYAAKLRIAQCQRPTDRFHYNPGPRVDTAALPAHAQPMNTADGLHFREGWFCRGGKRLFDDSDVQLHGVHNRRNAVAALTLTEPFGATPDHLYKVLAEFEGLPYRMTDEGVRGGIRWFNDSLSTAPESAAAAVVALSPGLCTLIAGGFDRGFDPAPLARAVHDQRLQTVVLLPETGRSVAEALLALGGDTEVVEVAELDEAVSIARRCTPAGKICLFSPGAPSYHRYRSFEERGEHFRTLIERYSPSN
jgi:UDP-N-acetylmuramoylalanine--D-glutamate ligase